MALPTRDDLHLTRRFWHFCGVLVIVVLEWILNPRQAAIAALSASAFMISFDILRLRSRRLNRFFTWLFGPFLRERETHGVTASAYMMAGVALIVCVFPKEVVLLALLFLAVADPLASYFGIRYGKDKLIGNKSLQGSLAAFAACFVISLVFYSSQNMMRDRLFIVCLLSGLIGAVSELVPVGKLDDNFVFPVLSATLLDALLYVFKGF